MQLNMYNFHKVRGDKHQNQFEHQKFKKGHQSLLYKIKRKQNDLPLLNAPLLDGQIHNQSPQSIQKEPQSVKHSKPLKTTINQSNIPQQTLENLQNLNKILKKTKTKHQNYLKNISSINQLFISEKFYKLIASLITEKIKKQLPQYKNDEENLNKEWPTNFDEVIEHIIGSDKPLEFDQYRRCAKKLFLKHSDNFFMLQKTVKEDQ